MLAPGILAAAVLGLLTGCISYPGTTAIPTPTGRVQVTGSHISVGGDSAKSASLNSAAPLSVYTHEDIERSGAGDLAGFLQRVPFVRVHR